MHYEFPPAPPPVLETTKGTLYAVRRIFCVGRNYADHAREMGQQPDRSAPFYFTKSPHHLTQADAVPFPAATKDYHHEVELAVLLDAGGQPWGAACALDMTRRDLQAIAKEKRRSWDVGKDVEGSAIFGKVQPGFAVGNQSITLSVDGKTRQSAKLGDMIHSVPDILTDLARFYDLGAGDVILTGTPAGVAAIERGETLTGKIEGLPELHVVFY